MFDDPPFIAEFVERVDEAAKTTSNVRNATDLEAGKVTRFPEVFPYKYSQPETFLTRQEHEPTFPSPGTGDLYGIWKAHARVPPLLSRISSAPTGETAQALCFWQNIQRVQKYGECSAIPLIEII
jgi:hypothetical protein